MLITEIERGLLTLAIVAAPSELAPLARVKADDFDDQLHRTIYSYARTQHAHGKRVDTVELSAHVLDKHPASEESLLRIVDARPDIAHIERYVSAILEASRRRKITGAAELFAASSRAAGGNFDRNLTEMQGCIEAANSGLEIESTEAVIERSLAELAEDSDRYLAGKTSGIPTGFAALDQWTGGWSEGLSFIVSWSSGGKTAFLVSSLLACGNAGHRFRLYSLDMPASRMLLRFASQQHGIPGEVVSGRRLTPPVMEQIHKTAAWMLEHGSICEASLTIDELVADALAYRDTCDIVAIDTLQSLRWDTKDTRSSLYERTCYACNRLKELKKRLRKPVLVAAQAKDPPDRREVAKGKVPPPTLNDAEGARRITQEAAHVVIVYRTDYASSASTSGNAKVVLAKSQSGMTGARDVWWDATIGRFEEVTYGAD